MQCTHNLYNVTEVQLLTVTIDKDRTLNRVEIEKDYSSN